ncbi:Allergen Asp [Geosmithia morbida]|uniref:Allergen Asp n=1 Tax=Geosmithia morbida TaxID=1094350 RepID=A0A9P5D3W5_9HYPO|nr:Allergen Asp [Geosmithia morbida]KAF4125402.1 Allergen Asp [Geosmithia morbida]
MKFSASVVLAAALGASAHPSRVGHKHAHRSLAERQEFVKAVNPVTVTTTITQGQVQAAAAPTAAPSSSSSSSSSATTTSSAAASSTSAASSSGGSGQGISAYTDFCSGNSKRATAAQIAYKGNTGTTSDYGCNMMLAQSSVAEEYDHVIILENASDDEQQCVCFNKIGSTGGINGFFTGNEALNFKLAAGETQHVVVDSNSQGGCTCGAGEVTLTAFGEFADTWLEFDMANESNDGWSGADASCLVSAAEGLNIPGLRVCDEANGSGTCSTINPGGTGTNAYLGGMEDLDGVGLNIPAGQVRLYVTVGYSS